MNYEYLNEVTKYIEDNLTNDIDFLEISRIACMNIFILERIFSFLTNMTLKEYIKLRRLSRAYEEIKSTDNKIIDIAFKYQFNSSSSFNRAFKNTFNISPSECRKNGNYKIMPMIKFPYKETELLMDYEIKNLDEKILYCYHMKEKNHDDLLYKIRMLFKNIDELENFYGIFVNSKEYYEYYLGSSKESMTLEKYKIEAGKFIVLKVRSEQKSIVLMEKKINDNWFLSTNYKKKNNIIVEKYVGNICYIMLPIE